jgi:hypothetical protein
MHNSCGGSIKVYPDASGHNFEGAAAGASVTIAATPLDTNFTPVSSTQWDD